jgi:hypothetical protein
LIGLRRSIKALGRPGNLIEYFGRQPLPLEIELAALDHFRDQRGDRAQFVMSDLRYFLKRAPFSYAEVGESRAATARCPTMGLVLS